MTYAEAIEFLNRLRLFGAELGLENTFKLAELGGNPQRSLRFIHVAGTNGKGSTCAMLESIYRAAGLRVGLFTSPHLVAFGERIQVDRRPISQMEIVRLVTQCQSLLKTFPAQSHPTFFEVVTIMALLHFAAQQCDLVIWETGMGGRLDATNIVTPLASVITNVQLDHEQWLGDSIEKIAFEKAGIIKPHVPVITAAEDRALAVIADVARQKQAPLTVVNQADAGCLPDNIQLPLMGSYQRLNAALAATTVRVLNEPLPTNRDALITGLASVNWPGRMQFVKTREGRAFLLDGAHNKAGAEMLAHEFPEDFPGSRPALVFGVLRDKDWKSMLAVLGPLATRVLLVPVKSERALQPDEMLSDCQQANPKAPVSVYASLEEALQAVKTEPLVVVTGSLYLVGEAMELLGLAASPTREERSLNEWGADTPSTQKPLRNELRPPK